MRRRSIERTLLVAVVGLLAFIFLSSRSLAQRYNPPATSVSIPAEPRVKPRIHYPLDVDTDRNGIDDLLDARLRNAEASVALVTDPQLRVQLARQLDEPVRVQLVFYEQITQAQVEAFAALGGRISYVYRSVSYGWNGVIPLRSVRLIPTRMGFGFCAMVADRPMRLLLDKATQNGRARYVWQHYSYYGEGNSTIGFIDSGIDGTHTDLAAKMEYWADFTDDAEPNPIDMAGHGTHVAGIALGTGNAGGTSGTLKYTDSGVPVQFGAYSVFPITLPTGTQTVAASATWLGGGSTRLAIRSKTVGARVGSNWLFAWEGAWSVVGTPVTGSSPLTKTATFSATPSKQYTMSMDMNSGVGPFAIEVEATYTGVDGFNTFSGVAPGCYWAVAKVFRNGSDSSPDNSDAEAAIDDLVFHSAGLNIKVINMSLSMDGGATDSTFRAKVNTAASNGVLPVIAAGNRKGGDLIGDPGTAGSAITVVACNDLNQLTCYSSMGFANPDSTQDNKPDIMAPGGSPYYSNIIAPDSNSADAATPGFQDVRPNDYASMSGTSMAAPFVSGAAALVIQGLQQSGYQWDFTSDAGPRLVKMLLCATATESNLPREVGAGADPVQGRRATSPKDPSEGYGMINVDAAYEGARLTLSPGTTVSDTTQGRPMDRRAWAYTVKLQADRPVKWQLTVPGGGDFDLYLYSGTPDPNGNPTILKSSTNAGKGVSESITYVPKQSETDYLVIKRETGSGKWTLSEVAGLTVTYPNGGERLARGWPYTIRWYFTGSPGKFVKIELLKSGVVNKTIAAGTAIGTGGSGTYKWTIPATQIIGTDYRIRVTSTSTGAVADTSHGDFTIADSFIANSPWPKVHADVRNTGVGKASGAKAVEQWEVPTDGPIYGSAAIGADGTVYIGSTDGGLYAIDGNAGAVNWVFQTNSPLYYSTPAIGFDGTVYIGTSDAWALALDGPTGAGVWATSTAQYGGAYASPGIGPDGTVYFPTGGWLVALSGDSGNQRWASGFGASSPALGQNGKLYVTNGSQIWAVDRETGGIAGGGVIGGGTDVAVGADGTLYVCQGNNVFAYDPTTFILKWRFSSSSSNSPSFQGCPAVTSSTVYATCTDGKAYAFNAATGAVKWQFDTGSAITTSPAIASDGTVYVTSTNGRLFAINGSSGSEAWEFLAGAGAAIYSSPVIAADGGIIFGSTDGKVYKVR